MSGKYAPEMIFADWVMCSAIAIYNSCFLLQNSAWKSREEQYISVMQKYTLEERKEFVRMLNLLTEAFEENMSDILGEIYMELGCGSSRTGQFFTPFHISKLTAECELANVAINENQKYEIMEPSAGGGGMIIATAAVLQERGINYQKCMKVVGQDLDWRSVYMAYVQFSLIGLDAVVVQGDSLCDPYIPGKTEETHILRTPMNMGVLL